MSVPFDNKLHCLLSKRRIESSKYTKSASCVCHIFHQFFLPTLSPRRRQRRLGADFRWTACWGFLLIRLEVDIRPRQTWTYHRSSTFDSKAMERPASGLTSLWENRKGDQQHDWIRDGAWEVYPIYGSSSQCHVSSKPLPAGRFPLAMICMSPKPNSQSPRNDTARSWRLERFPALWRWVYLQGIHVSMFCLVPEGVPLLVLQGFQKCLPSECFGALGMFGWPGSWGSFHASPLDMMWDGRAAWREWPLGLSVLPFLFILDNPPTNNVCFQD